MNSIDIQGVICNLPNVGWIYDWKLGKEVYVGVIRRSKDVEGCYWEVDVRWSKYRDWVIEERKMRERNPKFVHEELRKFIDDCWLYRIGGQWFMNNKVPTYITGVHWYFLSCYRMDVGLPRYKEIDKEYFYMWDKVVRDNNLFGMVELTKRRNGKSYRAGCIGLEMSSRTSNFNVGIQSKTDEDAKKFFKKTIVSPYRSLPDFFKPITNLANSGKMGVNNLLFEGKGSELGDELESMIDYGSSNETEYDGQKLGLYIGDEVGKTRAVNVNDRWDVVQFCLKDDEGRIIGKAIHTTTVERERTKKSTMKITDDTCDKNFLRMWQESDQSKMEDGKTVSGMVSFFISADRTRYIDKYGRADEERGYNDILKERSRLIDNPRKLANLKRKEPLNVQEAFQSDGESGVFNPEVLNQRNDELKWIKQQYVVGNFQWVDGIRDGDVEFVESVSGRFKVMYLPPEGKRNLSRDFGGTHEPNNKEMFCAGVDTYDHRRNSDATRGVSLSNGAIVIIKKHHPIYTSRVDGGPCCLYISRPSPEIFYEDTLMCLKYYGCQALIENNKPGLLHHLEDRGYSEYAVWLPDKSTRGIAASAKTNAHISELTDQFINDSCYTVFYEQLIDDWFGFSPEDTTKYDGAMAFGYALILLKNALSKRQTDAQTKKIEDYLSFFKAG